MASVSGKLILIVDGYSTGRELVRELNQRGAICVHLRSTQQIPKLAAPCFDATPYAANLGYLGTVREALARLPSVRFDAIVAGSEWGVTYAESLALALGLPTNRADTLSARRNKFDMIDQLRAHRLHAAQQARITSADEAHEWARNHGKWPVVVKPLLSAGSDGVVFCYDHMDIDRAVHAALYRDNLLGGFNDSLVIQSYLEGPQYIVNTVSENGMHRVTDAWHVDYRNVRGASNAMCSMTLLDPRAPKIAALFDYTKRAITALGIENGPAHSELRLTEAGPALIETGARLMGGMMNAPSYAVAGLPTQASCFADQLVARYRNEPAGRDTYERPRHFAKVFFVFGEGGHVASTHGLHRLAKLPSFHAHYRPLEPGARVWRSSDSLFCGGVVYLIHDDPMQIRMDIAQFRAWEAAHALYAIVPEPVPEAGTASESASEPNAAAQRIAKQAQPQTQRKVALATESDSAP
ncbi:ATP-grasp domain-containing protein [Paraburkholderia sp. SARCC-3016]|uniref:ATP-grasp domain-containing protein n=1 Tax=Paraburkholderia sp. SARCC-3016 TaxID=3058611 RepID=UPI0028091DC6|nr:ATP-grasp domain-containing protein [Paraburkholderia sp. SARCC-3016]MDQ7975972.1 ATP-grasp domain-containing protein [Paraburkholderia sp. SARCC-3016]